MLGPHVHPHMCEWSLESGDLSLSPGSTAYWFCAFGHHLTSLSLLMGQLLSLRSCKIMCSVNHGSVTQLGAILSFICQTSTEGHIDRRQTEEGIQGPRLGESVTEHLIWGTEAELTEGQSFR